MQVLLDHCRMACTNESIVVIYTLHAHAASFGFILHVTTPCGVRS